MRLLHLAQECKRCEDMVSLAGERGKNDFWTSDVQLGSISATMRQFIENILVSKKGERALICEIFVIAPHLLFMYLLLET